MTLLLIEPFPNNFEGRRALLELTKNRTEKLKKEFKRSSRARKRMGEDDTYFTAAFKEATVRISLGKAEEEWLRWKVGKALHVREMDGVELSPGAEFIEREFQEAGANEQPEATGAANEGWAPYGPHKMAKIRKEVAYNHRMGHKY